jgi:hypothetical protein
MADYIFPEVTANEATMTHESNTGVFRSDSGALQTSDRTGERWVFSLNHQNLKDADRRKLQAFVSILNGQEHRAYIRDFSYSGPSGTLSTISNLHPALTAANYDSASWQKESDVTFGVRYRRSGNTANGQNIKPGTVPTVTAGVSYALRTAVRAFSELPTTIRMAWISDTGGTPGGIVALASGTAATSVVSTGFTAPSSSITAGVTDNTAASGYGQFDIHRHELARCLLIDNGINELTYSEQFDNAAWTKTNSSVTANPSPGANAPNQTDTADEFVEDATAGVAHWIQQTHTRTSQAEFWTASAWLKQNTNQRIRLQIHDGSSNGGSAYFDASSGTITSGPTNDGTGSESTYASIHAYPDGWYRCRVSTRLPATTIARMVIYMCDGASNTTTYNGDGVSSVYLWGAQLQQGGQLGRYVQTTTAAATADSQTGSEIWVKGLDADTDGQLLAGDQVQIGDQLCILESDLDGDESGVGILVVRNRIRTAPSDEDPVVLYRPCGKFILASNSNSWSNRPGVFSDAGLTFIEDFAA